MARQKKAEGWSPELPKLTDKQMAYVHARIEGKNRSDAYREAYDAANMNQNSVWREASLLENHPKVAPWLLEGLHQGRIKAECTLEGHMAELARLRSIALETGNVGAAVQAEKIRGEVAGHKVERVEITDTRQLAEVMGQLEQAFGPAMARDMARAMGLQDEITH